MYNGPVTNPANSVATANEIRGKFPIEPNGINAVFTDIQYEIATANEHLNAILYFLGGESFTHGDGPSKKNEPVIGGLSERMELTKIEANELTARVVHIMRALGYNEGIRND